MSTTPLTQTSGQNLTFVAFESEVMYRLKLRGVDAEIIDDAVEFGGLSYCYNKLFSIRDTVSFLALSDQNLDEKWALKEMKKIEDHYCK